MGLENLALCENNRSFLIVHPHPDISYLYATVYNGKTANLNVEEHNCMNPDLGKTFDHSVNGSDDIMYIFLYIYNVYKNYYTKYILYMYIYCIYIYSHCFENTFCRLDTYFNLGFISSINWWIFTCILADLSCVKIFIFTINLIKNP